jgi:hypothetical protein
VQCGTSDGAHVQRVPHQRHAPACAVPCLLGVASLWLFHGLSTCRVARGELWYPKEGHSNFGCYSWGPDTSLPDQAAGAERRMVSMLSASLTTSSGAMLGNPRRVGKRECRLPSQYGGYTTQDMAAARAASRETPYRTLTFSGIVTICFSGTSSHACFRSDVGTGR